MADFWVFAYGSLMWHPGFEYEEAVCARLPRYHRALCMKSIIYRGTPKKPGLVLGLDVGGLCEGIAYRISSEKACRTRAYLHAREQVTKAYTETQKQIELSDGSGRFVSALCFIANRFHPQYAGRMSLQKQAGIIRRSSGRSGANMDYFLNTLGYLRQISIHDSHLERLAVVIGMLQMRRKRLFL